MDGKGEVPTPATCSGDFLAAIEGVLDALHAEGDIEGVALSLPGVIDAERGARRHERRAAVQRRRPRERVGGALGCAGAHRQRRALRHDG